MRMRVMLSLSLAIVLGGCAGFQGYDVSLVKLPSPEGDEASETSSEDASEETEKQVADESGESGKGATPDFVPETEKKNADRRLDVEQSAKALEGEITKGEIRYFGSTYKGEILNGEPHGQGKLTYSNGTTYEGRFFLGKFFGEGEIQYADGASYKGMLDNQVANGEGKAVTAEGIEAEGKFEDGTLVRGTLKLANGVVLKGSFENLVLQGEGEMITPVGAKYEGTFNEGRPTGVIVHTRQNGETRYHFWRNNKQLFSTVGPAELDGDYKDGCQALNADDREMAVVEGDCQDGLLVGEGVAFDTGEGMIYDGVFRRGYLTKGATFRPEGDFRRGSWKESSPHGKVKVFEDGALVYDGRFREGTRHGDGVCVINGEPQKCEYYKGERSDKLWLHKRLKEDLAELDAKHEDRMARVRENIEEQRERFEEQYQSRLDSINSQINSKQTVNVATSALNMWAADQMGASVQSQADRAAELAEEVRRLERERAELKEEHARESRRREREWEREERRKIRELQREYDQQKNRIIAKHRKKCTRIPGKKFVRSDLYCVDK